MPRVNRRNLVARYIIIACATGGDMGSVEAPTAKAAVEAWLLAVSADYTMRRHTRDTVRAVESAAGVGEAVGLPALDLSKRRHGRRS